MLGADHNWRRFLLLAGLSLPPLLAILADLSSGPLRAFTVLPYLFATLGCYWTGSSKTLLIISAGSLILLSIGTVTKGSDQLLFYVNRATFGVTLMACAFITHRAIQSRQNLVQQSLAQVLEDLDAGLAIFGVKQTLIFANTAFTNIFSGAGGRADFGEKGSEGLSFNQVVQQLSTGAASRPQPQQWLAPRPSEEAPESTPLQLRLPDGRYFQLYVQDLELGRTIILHDISSIKSYQAQAIQASKLALLGELAASLAHEISQPLGAIELTTDNIALHLDHAQEALDADFIAGKVERTRTATQKARKVVDHLRRFGRDAKEDPVQVDLVGVLYSAVDLMRDQLVNTGVELMTELPERTVSVMAHPIQLEQVFLNLLANARDAVAEGVPDPCVSVSLEVEDDVVRVTVADNGSGVPEALQSDIFKAFYTTKAIGKGTGLGLSVSRGIVEDFNGVITLSSSTHGAVFEVTLPMSHGHATAA